MPYVDGRHERTQPGAIGNGAQVGRFLLCGLMVMGIAPVLLWQCPGPANASGVEPACPVVRPMRLNLPALHAAIAHRQPIEVVALGSSSTEGTGASAPDRAYPAQLQAMLRASWPGVQVSVENKGVGGQTADAVLARIDADVLPLHPTLVIWQIGTNEILRGMDPGRFDALLDEGLRRLTAAGGDVVLMDYQIAPRMPPEGTRAVYGAIIANEAKAHGVSLFSRAALMRMWQANDLTQDEMIGPDGLHHSDHGYTCIAAALDDAIATEPALPRPAAVSVNLK